VNDHLKAPKGCELLEVVQQDGITNEIVEKLRSKKKSHRDQSEEDRWKEIYQILFPGEMVPSPCKSCDHHIVLLDSLEMYIFRPLNHQKYWKQKLTQILVFEEIQEDIIQTPDSQELADYEQYCRRELPRVFRASLEEIVNNNTQPLEEQLRSQLMDLIRDAQDQVFSGYRSSSMTTGTPARGGPSSSPPTLPSSSLSQGFSISPPRSQPTISNPGNRSQSRLPAFFQPPSPQNHLESGLDISDRNTTPSKPDSNDRSDSGYDSGSFVLPSTQPLTPVDSAVNSSAESLPLLEMNQETAHYADHEIDLTQAKPDSDTEAVSSSRNGSSNSEAYLPLNLFDFDLDSDNLSNFDMGDFGNCDFSQNLDGFFSV
jgi:hypothetical protein